MFAAIHTVLVLLSSPAQRRGGRGEADGLQDFVGLKEAEPFSKMPLKFFVEAGGQMATGRR